VSDTPLVIVGRIRKAHGIRGEVLVDVQTETPDAIFAPGARVLAGDARGNAKPSAPSLHVESVRPFKDLLCVAFDEITDRTEAEKWRDRYLLVPEGELVPPGDDEVFVHQLAGLDVVLESGEPVGRVLGTFDVGGRLLLEVQRASDTVFVPYELPFLVRVDLAAGQLVMSLPEGLFD
jgi:16S rRNA processing protein RimM